MKTNAQKLFELLREIGFNPTYIDHGDDMETVYLKDFGVWKHDVYSDPHFSFSKDKIEFEAPDRCSVKGKP